MEIDCRVPVSVVLPDPTNSVETVDDFDARPIDYYTFYGTDTQQVFNLDIWPDMFESDVLGGNDGDR